MIKKAHELIFISQILRDGTGVEMFNEKDVSNYENRFIRDEEFKLHSLSMTEKTYIAIGFNSYVVRLK